MIHEQMDSAMEAMIHWLSDPHELGRKPARIKFFKELKLYDMNYYIFKYKKSLIGKWFIGVCGGYEETSLEHCGHVFSEMKEFNEETAVQSAIEMVDMIRAYWMECADNFEK